MRQALALLVISMMLLGNGCVGATAAFTPHREYSRCPRPAMPDLPDLDPAQHLCAPANLESLMALIDGQRWFIAQQAAALDCYEAQAAPVGK